MTGQHVLVAGPDQFGCRAGAPIVESTRPACLASISVLTAAFLVAAPSVATGQVLEIADGVAIHYDGPAIYTADGVTPIHIGIATAAIVRAPKDSGAIVTAIERAAQVRGLPSALVTAVAWQESRFRPDSVSPKGAVGVMQLTDAAAKEIGVDRFNVWQNIDGGAAYLRRQLDAFGGDLTLALAAYNAGPGAVQRHGGVPPFEETRNYVTAVLADYARRAARDSSGATY